MDNKVAAERMHKFGIVAETMMPEVLIYSTPMAGAVGYIAVFGGPITKENCNAILMAVASIAKQRGWL